MEQTLSESDMEKNIKDEILKKIRENRLSCASAFKISKNFGITPSITGDFLDKLDIRINKCQMGLFGYIPEKKIIKPLDFLDDKLKEAINNASSKGRLSCENAWNIADRLKIDRMTVSAGCETMGIKITQCQLGAF